MARHPALSQDDLREAVEAFRAHGGNKTHAAQSLGLKRSAYRHRLNLAGQYGLLGPTESTPGYFNAQVTTQYDADGNAKGHSVQQKPIREPAAPLPAGFKVNALSRYTDGDGNLIGQWEKSKVGQPDVEDLIEAIKAKLSDLTAYATIPAPEKTINDQLTLYPLADWHLGMKSWGEETGTNWDLKIANHELRSTIGNVFQGTRCTQTAIVLGGGDFMHADNMDAKTAKSGNALDVDGRYPKVLLSACVLLADVVSMALQKHEKVIVRVLPGNHDEHASYALTYFLVAKFENNPRVTIDTTPNLYFHYQFGKTMIFAAHGHAAKPAKIPSLMAAMFPQIWGETKHRYGYSFHIHHVTKSGDEAGGVITETFHAPIPPDAYHHGAGYATSGRTMCGITFSKNKGEINRVTESL